MKKYLLATLFAAAFALCGAKVQAQNYIVVDSEKIFKSIENFDKRLTEIEFQVKMFMTGGACTRPIDDNK